MLLGKKPKYSLESEWAVVLDRSPNEFSKNRAIDKLAEVFSLSSEEAKDLIENTPIILLDRLSLQVAEKVKGHFSQANVNCSLTNDTFTKRKCFRAVWPEQPDLGHLLNGPISDFNKDIPELTPQPEISAVQESPVSQEPSAISDYIESEDDEQRKLKELAFDLQKENEMLRLQVEKVEESVRERERRQWNIELETLKSERLRSEEALERIRNENRALHVKAEELDRMLKTSKKVEGERESFTKSQSEEAISRLRKENSALSSKITELEQEVRSARFSAQAERDSAVKGQASEFKTQIDNLRVEYTKEQNAIRIAQNETKQFQMESAQIQRMLSEARTETEDLNRMLSQAQANSVQLKEDNERLRLEIESRLQGQSAELDEWKRKANDWNASYFKVMKENEFLRAHQSEELESLRMRNQQLSGQWESAQRQIRDFTVQLEQQELIQKRIKVTSELSEHEARLKSLVQKQQTLESEICLREDEMKEILAEQETIEREIITARQAQKYLLEQGKLKEKSRLIRPKNPNQGSSFSEESGNVTPSADA